MLWIFMIIEATFFRLSSFSFCFTKVSGEENIWCHHWKIAIKQRLLYINNIKIVQWWSKNNGQCKLTYGINDMTLMLNSQPLRYFIKKKLWDTCNYFVLGGSWWFEPSTLEKAIWFCLLYAFRAELNVHYAEFYVGFTSPSPSPSRGFKWHIFT